MLTPFVLSSDFKTILINRGFIPWNGRRDKLADISIGQVSQEVKVQISKPIKRMELKSSEVKSEFPILLQVIDIEEMSALADINFSNVIGLLDADAANGFVRKWEPYTGSIEKHIGYAVQWFLMAFVLAIIGIRLGLKQRKK